MTSPLAAFVEGAILAAGLILPLGPQNVFVLNQGTLHKRWRSAVPAAVTASVCDTLLILLAVLGVSVAVLAADWLNRALTGAGVLFLAYMGWTTWPRHTGTAAGGTGDDPAVPHEAWPARRQVAFAVSVSLLNPHAIMDTVAVLGPASLSHPAGAARLAFTAACIINSWVWFFLLITVGHTLRASGRVEQLRLWFNRASALVMWYTASLLLRRLIGAL
ncbi:MAG: LysE/ArgO family amino acid transporter [Chloroflexota bacterium]